MAPSQVPAAQLVLRKILPDLKPVKVEYEAAPSYVDAIRAGYRCDLQNRILPEVAVASACRLPSAPRLLVGTHAKHIREPYRASPLTTGACSTSVGYQSG
ncbi:MAG: hypothetical protein M3120_10570 [Pseudomonadota bacterium]|nr:hypothetical protein [Pseudomonadota bacterium]